MIRTFGVCYVVAAALFLGSPLAAQEVPATEESPQVAVILVETLRAAAQDDLIARILMSGVEQALQSYGIEYQPVDRPAVAGTPELPEEHRISVVLGSLSADQADVIVGVFYLAQDDQLFVQFVLYDPIIATVLGGVLTRSRRGLTVFDSVASAVSEFEPVIQRYIEGGYYAEEPKGLVQDITVQGATEGAEVFFIERLVGTIAGGDLFVPFTQFEIGTPLRVRVTKEGYHDVEETYRLDTPSVTIPVEGLRQETRFDLGLRWSLGLAPGLGLGARFHLAPDTTFVALEHYRTFQPAPDSNARDVQFYDTNLTIGRYFLFSYRSMLRASLSVGAGMIVSDVDDLPGREYIDWYLLVGNPTVELNLDRLGFFVRPELKYALGLGYNTLGRVWIRTGYETGMGSFAIMPITLGVRYSW